MKKFTSIVNRLPTATDARLSDITNDFISGGACVYENSRHVTETMTSAAVITRNAKSCQAMLGVCPRSTSTWAYAEMPKATTVRKKPSDTLRSDVSRTTRLISG